MKQSQTLEGVQLLKENDLKETVSSCTYKGRFDILQGDVYITPGEILNYIQLLIKILQWLRKHMKWCGYGWNVTLKHRVSRNAIFLFCNSFFQAMFNVMYFILWCSYLNDITIWHVKWFFVQKLVVLFVSVFGFNHYSSCLWLWECY